MKKVKGFGSFISVLLVLAAFSGLGSASERGAFPSVGVGARSLGMGGAFVAVANDVSSVYWNPAGLAQLQRGQFTSMRTDLLETGIDYNFLAYAQPFTWGTVGVSWLGLDASKAFGMFPYRETSYVLSFAGRQELVDGLQWGANLKFNRVAGGSEVVFGEEQGLGCDLGLLWRQDKWNLGLVVRDLYTKLAGTLTEEERVSNTKVKLTPDISVGAAYKTTQAICALEVGELFNSPTPRLGVEYAVNSSVTLRAGYTPGTITAGLGIQAGNWVLDYAYNTHEVGDAQRFSLGYAF